MKNSVYILVISLFFVKSMATNAQSVTTIAPDIISISVLNTEAYESWTRPANVVIRRHGGLKAVTIPIVISGTASQGIDYQSSVGTSVTIPMGAREVFIQISPLTDAIVESNETVTIQLQTSAAYTISGTNIASVTIKDISAPMNDEEASRFLIQAGFGADPDELLDVKALGFSAWIDQQIARPKGYLEPIIIAKIQAGLPIYHPETKIALWTQFMRRRYPSPGITVNTDILRQRVAYSLLQIFVISQNVDALLLSSQSVVNYYDKLMDGAFGNFKQLLLDVSMHPMMGIYLSHLGNRKANPAVGQFPDENFAREVMQLFSIGLWELNQNGTRKLDNLGNPIPTYNNNDISTFARVFTGINLGGPDNGSDFENINNDLPAFLNPMKGYDAFHDQQEKILLNGTILPAGRTTMQDINDAIDNLVNHPNTGPFISRLLIQRLITSNPSPDYIGRVSAVFANNGSGVRGDMAAVVKAILLDTEARSFSKTLEPTFGKMREPYMTLMNIAKTFNAQPSSGNYESATYMYDFYLQEPFQSPSVFNFYLPNHRPPGELTRMGLYGPEFQILTAVTAVETQNNLLNSVEYEISRWGSNPGNEMILNFSQEIPLASDPDALIRLLSTKMIGGNLRPRSFQNIREAVLKIPNTDTNWQSARVKMAAYLIGASAEFNIQR
jgi:uncharacterized protein (DUF1800 family)